MMSLLMLFVGLGITFIVAHFFNARHLLHNGGTLVKV